MEITKRSLSIVLILVAALCSVFAQPAGRNRKPQATWDNYALKITEQIPEFGGFWFQNGRPVIGLTRLSATAKAKSKLLILAALKTRESKTGPFIYRRVDHNFTTIHSARRTIRSLLRERNITFLDTDERSNIVRVGIRKASDEATVRQKILGMGIAEGLFRIEVRSPVKDLVDLIDDLRKRVRPLIGGLETVSPAGNNRWSICSLGLVGRRNGVRGLLTNSHCTRVTGQLDGEPFFQYHWTNDDNRPDDPGDRVGFETVDAPILTSANTDECSEGDRCQYADAAFVQLDSTVGARRGFVKGVGGGAPVEYEIDGVVPFGACGQKVKKVGRTTGLTRGEVESTCSDYEYTSGLWKLCQDEISAGAGEGDSGSAALLEHISPNSTRVQFYGLVNGGDSDHIIVSPYLMVISQLGNIDVMPGNDPPQVRITTPTSGASFGMNPLNDKVRFEANIFDPEGKNCGMTNSTCTVEWRSDKDGVIGTGQTAEFFFRTPGLHSITATAKDGSLTAFDQIAVNISSTPPSIEIVEPNGGPYYRGIPYVLYARATDSDAALLVPVECNRFTWMSNNPADIESATNLPKNFCEVITTFNTLGSRTLSVEARDPGGDRNTKTIPVNVVARPTTGPPIVTLLITSRAIGSNPGAGYFLRAAIWDPDGGETVAYKWKVKYGTTEKVIRERQAAGRVQISDPWRPADHVPNRCGGWNAVLTLEAVDDQGQKTSVALPINVRYPLC
jgi:hypothetical protein